MTSASRNELEPVNLYGDNEVLRPTLASLDGMVLMHLKWLRERSLAAGTIQGRRLALTRLSTWLTRPPIGATREELEEFVRLRRRGKIGNGTPMQDDSFRTELAHLRGFYTWAQRFEFRHDNPTARIPLPRKQATQIESIPDRDLARIMRDVDDSDRALLALSAFAGLRAMEVAGLDWRDVNRERTSLVIRHGKGGKSRRVAISAPLRAALDALPHRTGPVIRRRDGNGGPCTPNAITKRGVRVLGGRRDGWTLHQLRHRFATAAYRGTHDLRAVQDALGHSSPSVTAIYVDADAAARDAAVEAAARLAS